MLELVVSAPPEAAARILLSRFPTSIGRGACAAARLEYPGVWEDHLRIEIDDLHRLVAVSRPGATTILNGSLVNRALLRNGDCVELGAVKLRVWLSPVAQRSFCLREAMFWLGLALLLAAEAALAGWLLTR